ncbi:hypothetical protein BDZ89DRAFT_1064483, partial [Hymenopellis radicata]
MVQRTPSPFEMRELFISSHKTAVHPLVWNKLVTLAASNGAFRLSDPKVTAGAHARFIAVMLPEYPSLANDTGSPRTLRRALEVSPPPALWDNFLQMPALMAFDVGPSSSLSISLRALLAAAKFALHHIDEGHTLPEVDIDVSSLASEAQSHWTLLETVLSYLSSLWALDLDEPIPVLRDEVIQLLEQIIGLEAFRHLNSLGHTPSIPIHLLDGCTSSILLLRYTCAFSNPSYPLRPIHATLLHIAMSRLQYNLHSVYTQHPMDSVSFYSIERLADSLMAEALDSGHHEAYCLFVQDEWMQRFGPLWIAGWAWSRFNTTDITPGIIDRYVSGLTSPSMAVSRQQFVDHLYEPENLAIAVCVVFTDAESLRSLTALNPTHPSWDRCRALMESIIAWNRNPNREITEFPGDYLLSSKVVQCADRSVHLEEHIRRRFTGEKAREKLDMALQIMNES